MTSDREPDALIERMEQELPDAFEYWDELARLEGWDDHGLNGGNPGAMASGLASERGAASAMDEEPQAGYGDSSWEPVDLGPIIAGVEAGEIVGPTPQLMPRSDGVCLFYPGEIHSLAGEPESCKDWIVLNTVAELIRGGEDVLHYDFEDSAASIVTRLLALGAPAEAILDHLAYVRPAEPFSKEAFSAVLGHKPYKLALIDGLSEAYALLGLEINSNDDAAKFLTVMPRPLADRGAAVVEIDHVGRDKEQRGRYAIGAQHKLAGVAVAYSTDVVDAPSRIKAGLVKLKINKDRHGHVRGHAIGGLIAEVRITPEDGGERVRVTIAPPPVNADGKEPFRPTRLMEHTSKAVEANPGINATDLRTAVRGDRTEAKALALKLLIAEKYVESRTEKRAVCHYSLRAYREATGPQREGDGWGD